MKIDLKQLNQDILDKKEVRKKSLDGKKVQILSDAIREIKNPYLQLERFHTKSCSFKNEIGVVKKTITKGKYKNNLIVFNLIVFLDKFPERDNRQPYLVGISNVKVLS